VQVGLLLVFNHSLDLIVEPAHLFLRILRNLLHVEDFDVLTLDVRFVDLVILSDGEELKLKRLDFVVLC